MRELNPEDFAVPRRLDDPEKLLWWSIDVFISAIVALGVGVLIGSFLLGAVLCWATVYGMSRLKAGGGPGHVRRVIYWHLPANKFLGLRRTPPSHIREFVG